MKTIECRDCNRSFNPHSPDHKPYGYFNQCADCAEETGATKIKPYKALTISDEIGDWQGIKIVTAEKFEEIKRVEAMYSGIAEDKGKGKSVGSKDD